MPAVLPPPFRIFLLRHASADWAKPGETDFDRALNGHGYAEAEVVADKALDKGYRPDLVLSSTARRCRETADALARGLCGMDVPFRFIDALYNAPVETYLELLQSSGPAASVMMIGHNPAMEELLHLLAGGDVLASAIPQGYPPAGLAVLDAITGNDDTRAGWHLVDFVAA
ncbi:SixA phosphatase family protein [Rhizobium paknamense]|uniref:Phosphohistidine phosphatase n=1 Tax=Rhizobium paknamense TaxID=1206817 RepID=A0ABU0I6J9_9HYPH|nr:histidine phosphatase family protein [Rhizobium paknamense]MDQ0453836.1 phosphohistidine phosphatase [Rhizobium paknamense]